MILSGWGRFPRAECRFIDAHDRKSALEAIAANPSLIARGNGRSYGDSSLNPGATLGMTRGNRLRDFDQDSGLLDCEAGVMLADILETFVPRGWFPPVTPGTKFVTIGGMIAADVHGKNHHRDGAFGSHVESLELALAGGNVATCSASENAGLFAATRGGMGLTGVILSARFRLKPIATSSIRQETLICRDLDETMARFEDSKDWTYTVAWIDCLARGGASGRSLLYRGEHAALADLPQERRAAPLMYETGRAKRVPADFPVFALNRWSVAAFNEIYYRRARPGTDIVDFERFFYPLDSLLEWNRIYGRKGFVQYQCVLPKKESRQGLGVLLARISEAGAGSFLSVLKLLGPSSCPLSFPMEGYTLALDFPASKANLELLDSLDGIVAAHGGRVYLAKDARLAPGMVRQFYPELGAFEDARLAADPGRKFASLQSQRLGL